MSEFRDPEEQYIGELEKDKKFVFMCMYYITKIILTQKFGSELYEQFIEYENTPGGGEQALYNILTDNEPTKLLFPQMKNLAEKIEDMDSLNDMIAFAKEQGVDIKNEQVNEIKQSVISDMAEDSKWENDNN